MRNFLDTISFFRRETSRQARLEFCDRAPDLVAQPVETMPNDDHETGRRNILRYLLCLILATPVLLGGVDLAQSAGVSKQEFENKIAYCQDCHGSSGQGYRGFYPIPRLAGQQAEYIKNQLQAFVEHRRTNNIMLNVAHGLSPSMIDALAERFGEFNPKPLGGGRTGLFSAGMKIFQDGVPEADVAACAACHGPNATGKNQFPRLAGQLNEYLINKLVNWDKERGQIAGRSDPSAIMVPVAHSLTRQQVEAVSAYLSNLK